MIEVFRAVRNVALPATAVMAVVLLLRWILPNFSKRARCALWALVLIALTVPIFFHPASRFSLMPASLSNGNFLDNLSNDRLGVQYIPEGGETYDAAIASGADTIYHEYQDVTYAVTGPDGISPPKTVREVTQPYFAWGWFAGMCLMLGYALFSFFKLRHRMRGAESNDGKVYYGDHVATPFILGVVRPRIYLPASMNEAQVPMVLAHEKAHLQRGDHVWKVLGYVLLAVYWFHPLCWLCYKLFCRDIELACDEKVVQEFSPEQRADYSQALLMCSAPEKFHLSCPLAFGEVGVKERVVNILNYKKPAFWVTIVAIAVCIVAAVAFLTEPARPRPTKYEVIEDGTYELVAVQDASGDFYRTSERFQAAFPQSDVYPSQLTLEDGAITWTFGPQVYTGTYEKVEQDFPVHYRITLTDRPEEEWGLYYQYNLSIGQKDVPLLQLEGTRNHEVYLYADPGEAEVTTGTVPMLFRALLPADSSDYVDCGVTLSSPTDQLLIHNYDLFPKSFRLLDESGQEVHSGEFGQYGDAYKTVTVMRVTPNAPYRLEIRSDSDRMETARFIVHDGNTGCGGLCHMVKPNMEDKVYSTMGSEERESMFGSMLDVSQGFLTYQSPRDGSWSAILLQRRSDDRLYEVVRHLSALPGKALLRYEGALPDQQMHIVYAVTENITYYVRYGDATVWIDAGPGNIWLIDPSEAPEEVDALLSYLNMLYNSTDGLQGQKLSGPDEVPPIPDEILNGEALLAELRASGMTLFDYAIAQGYYPTYMEENSIIICDSESNCTVTEGGSLWVDEMEERPDINIDQLVPSDPSMRVQSGTKVTYDMHGFIQNIYYEIPGKPGEYQLSPPTPAQKYGTTERLTYDSYGLELEITGVHELRKETFREPVTDEVFETWEGAVCVVYPGAMATVLNADMTDDGDFSWVFYESNTGEHLPVTDGMAPVLVAEKMDGIGRESVLILRFEVYQGD